jgi:hypothetical protein
LGEAAATGPHADLKGLEDFAGVLSIAAEEAAATEAAEDLADGDGPEAAVRLAEGEEAAGGEDGGACGVVVDSAPGEEREEARGGGAQIGVGEDGLAEVVGRQAGGPAGGAHGGVHEDRLHVVGVDGDVVGGEGADLGEVVVVPSDVLEAGLVRVERGEALEGGVGDVGEGGVGGEDGDGP